ncbi:MAG: FAD-dependent monooxygenase [Sandaracinus sp.]|nr:FAD-dependent monooxygenase [Sandaracinus sp.]
MKRAIVVGAGVAGPVVACWLKRIGWDVEVVEARATAAPDEGAFLGLAPNGVHVLRALGLAEAIGEIGHACAAFRFFDRHGKVLGEFDRRDDTRAFGAPLTMVRRGELHLALVREAERRGVPLRFGDAVRSVDALRGEVELVSGTRLVGDLVIGCDGAGSRLREALGGSALRPSGLFDYGGFARVEGLPFESGVQAMVFGRRAFFGAFTDPTGLTWWFHNGPRDLKDGGAAGLVALHAEDPPWVRALVSATPKVLGPWRLWRSLKTPRWSHERVVLIGDAAHAMPPSAGQGASLALEDAMALARSLRDHEVLPDALRAYEAARRPRVRDIGRVADRNGSGKAPSTAVGAWIRDRVLERVLPAGEAAQSASYAHREPW